MNKKIIFALMALVTLFTGCKNEDPFTAASPDDQPRFLSPSAFVESNTTAETVARDKAFEFTVLVVPVDYTTIQWKVGDEVIAEGASISKTFLAGTYNILIDATTTAGLKSWRKVNLTVTALATDPTVEAAEASRVYTPGQVATIAGSNLDKVTSILIGGTEITNFTLGTDGKISVNIPSSIAAGKYQMIFKDAAGVQYGCDSVSVTSSPTIFKSKFSALASKDVTLEGVNLQNVDNIVIGGTAVAPKSKSYNSVVVTVPALEPGDYTMTATANGTPVFFGVDTKSTQAAFTVKEPSEDAQEIWSGTINAPEWGANNATLNTIVTNLINNAAKDGGLPVGTRMIFHGSKTASDYCSMALIDQSWTSVIDGTTGDNRTCIHFDKEDDKKEFTVSQKTIDIIKNGGFYINGHGFTLTSVEIIRPVETVFEGTISAPEWGPSNTSLSDNVKALVTSGRICEGTKFTIYGSKTASDYCSLALIDGSWTSVIDGTTGDNRTCIHFEKADDEQKFTATAATVSTITSGGFHINGHGFTLTKIEIQ